MNTLLRFAAAGLAVAGLTACAGTHNLAVADATRQSQPPAATELSADARYVATVEYVARQRGVEVRWVNPPRRDARPRQ